MTEPILFTETTLKIPVWKYQFNPAQKYHVLIIGGVHGDEPEGIIAAEKILQQCLQKYSYSFSLTLIPCFNPEGKLAKNRQNTNGVDLNRNLPTQDWTAEFTNPRYNPGRAANSEKENQALVKLLETEKIDLIISLHSWNPMINVNGDCNEEAKILADHTGYTIEPYIGYPTPGSLGTYAGREKQIPTITYEIQKDQSWGEVNRIHPPGIFKLFDFIQRKQF